MSSSPNMEPKPQSDRITNDIMSAPMAKFVPKKRVAKSSQKPNTKPKGSSGGIKKRSTIPKPKRVPEKKVSYPSRPDEAHVRKRMLLDPLSPENPHELRCLSTVSGDGRPVIPPVSSTTLKKPVPTHRSQRARRRLDDEPRVAPGSYDSLISESVSITQEEMNRTYDEPSKGSSVFVIDESTFLPSTSLHPEKTKASVDDDKYMDTLLQDPDDRRTYNDLTARMDGYLICPTTVTASAPMESNSSAKTTISGKVSMIKRGHATDSYPVAMRKSYAIDPPPEVSFKSPLIGDELEGAIFCEVDDKASTLEMKNGEIVALIPHLASAEPRKTSLTVDDKNRGLFGTSLPSGQSIRETDQILDKALGRNSTESGINLSADVPYPAMSDMHKQNADAMSQRYLYRPRHTASELWAIVEQTKYGEHFGMLKEQLGELSQMYPNLGVRTRALEESFLREPIGSERPCVHLESCMGNRIPNGCTLAEYPNPEVSKYYKANGKYPKKSVPGLCVMCSRDGIMYLHAHVDSLCRAYRHGMLADLGVTKSSPPSSFKRKRGEGGVSIIDANEESTREDGEQTKRLGRSTSSVDTHPLVLSNYTNVIGPGEYAPESCISGPATGQHEGLLGCFVIHSITMYKVKMHKGVLWFVQQYPKPIEVPFAQHDDTPFSQTGFYSLFLSLSLSHPFSH